jgi:preprotein translocase subunit SecY
MNNFTAIIADWLTGGLITKQKKKIEELEGQVLGWQQLLKSVMPIVEARAGQILQETWKELMSEEQSFTTSKMPENLQKHFTIKKQ